MWFVTVLVLIFGHHSVHCLDYPQTYSELDGRCETVKDCRPFGYICMRNNTCKCDYMYIPDAKNGKCLGGIDQKCVYDEHCIVGAYCMNQEICKCKETTPMVLDYGLACGNSSHIHVLKLSYILMVITFTITIW